MLSFQLFFNFYYFFQYIQMKIIQKNIYGYILYNIYIYIYRSFFYG